MPLIDEREKDVIKKCLFTGLFFGGVVGGGGYRFLLNIYRCVFNDAFFNMAEEYVEKNVEINRI